MSTKLKNAAQKISRQPQQGRSKASLERMLVAARELMLERGNEDFTLQDVSQRGSISIGSIYLRFESKDNLVRAVIFDALDTLAADENAVFDKVRLESTALDDFMPNFVEGYAEVLRNHAPLLRLSMQRASFDPLVASPGKQRALNAEAAVTNSMLNYAKEFGGDEDRIKATSAYHIIFATLARQLSLGSTEESANEYDWDQLKRELGRMCLAYLKSDG